MIKVFWLIDPEAYRGISVCLPAWLEVDNRCLVCLFVYELQFPVKSSLRMNSEELVQI